MTDSVAECYVNYEHVHDTNKGIHSCLTFNILQESVTSREEKLIENTVFKTKDFIGTNIGKTTDKVCPGVKCHYGIPPKYKF